MTIRTHARLSRLNKDGLLPIFFEYKRHRFATNETCKRAAWDKKSKSVSSNYSGASFINNRLTEKKKVLIDIIKNHPGLSPAAIGELFHVAMLNFGEEEKVTPVTTIPVLNTFEEVVDEFIRRNRHKLSKGYLKRFNTIKVKFMEKDPHFRLEIFTEKWWQNYTDWCIDEKENTNNTLNADAKAAKRLVETLVKEGHRIPIDPDNIQWKYVEPGIMSISWEKVKIIADHDLSDPLRATFPGSRDFWLISAYTGRRCEEIQNMTPKNFYKDSDGRWRYKSAVTKGMKEVDIPLLPEAIDLLKRLKFTPPKLAQQTVNSDIKEIAKAAKLQDKVLVKKRVGKKVEEKLVEECDTIHIHTGRHSYAMHLVEESAGHLNREKWISEMLGHASFTTTWRYINLRQSTADLMYDEIIGGKTKSVKPVKKSRSRKS